MKKNTPKTIYILLLLILLFFTNALSFIFFSHIEWLNYGISGLFILTLVYLLFQNKKSLRTRSAAFGLQSFTSILLVFFIIALINFVAYRYPKEFDLTKNQIHTLSEQTEKLIKGIEEPMEAIFFASNPPREDHTVLLTKFKNLNPLFNFRLANPNKELVQAKTLGINRINTLVLQYKGKTSTVEEPTEEKLTNSIIKITQTAEQIFCMLSGHGEASLESGEPDGYQNIKKALENQAYKVQELNIPSAGEVPSSCSVIGIVGPKSAFFEAEVKAIEKYLDQGGRALIAIDINLEGKHSAIELMPLLKKWHIEPKSAFLVDPMSRFLGLDASIVPITSFAKDHAVTKEMQGSTQALFPVSFPVGILPNPPTTLKITSLGQTTPQSWGETDFIALKKQEVSKDSKDLSGPVSVALAIEGSLSKDVAESKNKTKIVFFTTSQFSNNQFSRFGGNLDFFMNAASWLLDNESLISIRGKESEAGKVELTSKMGQFIFFLVVIAIPLIVALIGFAVRWKRRRL